MPRLCFTPSGKTPVRDIPLSPAWNLLTIIQRAGAAIRHDCGGKALCGTCRLSIEPAEGEGPGAAEDEGLRRGLSAMGQRERERLVALGAPLDGSVRLACQLHAARDLEARALVPLEEP